MLEDLEECRRLACQVAGILAYAVLRRRISRTTLMGVREKLILALEKIDGTGQGK